MISLLAWLSAAAPLAPAACSKDTAESSEAAAGSTSNSAGAGAAQSAAAHGGSTGSSGHAANAAGNGGSANAGSAAQSGAAGSESEAVGGDAGDAGTDDTNTDAATGELTTAVATGVAKAMCSALLDCVGPSGLRSLVGRERCEDRFSAAYAQNAFALLEDSIARKRVHVHSDRLEDCYRDTAALGCDVQRDRPPSSCSQAIEGLVAIGDTCSNGWDCAGDAFCSGGECPRTCVARVAAGSACGSDNDCVSGLLCVGQKCVAPASMGEHCGGHASTPCVLDAACAGGDEDTEGTCRANQDILSADLGAACDLDTVYCKEGLSCGYDGKALSCQSPVSSGEKCHLAAPAQCPIEEFCNATSLDQEGRCQALPKEGEACVLDGQCAAGFACVLEAQQPVCRTLRDLGEACNQAGECRSGSCVDTHCAAGSACE